MVRTSVEELTCDGAVRFWKGLLSGMDVYKEYGIAIAKNEMIGPLRNNTMLFRAVTQTAFIYAAKELRDIPWTEAVKVLNSFDWSENNPEWMNVLVIEGPDKSLYSIKGKKQPKKAGRMIAEKIRKKIKS